MARTLLVISYDPAKAAWLHSRVGRAFNMDPIHIRHQADCLTQRAAARAGVQYHAQAMNRRDLHYYVASARQFSIWASTYVITIQGCKLIV